MVLSGEMMVVVRADILRVMSFLVGQNKEIDLVSPETIATYVYTYYGSHGKEMLPELSLVVQRKLEQTVIGIQSLKRFDEQTDRKLWHCFYSWKLSEDVQERLIDSCTVRLYLNIKLEHIDEVVVKLMRFYLKVSNRVPLMFKLPDPVYVRNNLKFIEGADKVVLYVNPNERLVEKLEAHLLTYPSYYFYETVPLFCRRVRNGVGIAHEPKENSIFVNMLKGLLGRNEISLSYGQYMSYLVSQGIRLALFELKLKRYTDTVNFSGLSDAQVRTITQKTLLFVFARMKEDLHLQ